MCGIHVHVDFNCAVSCATQGIRRQNLSEQTARLAKQKDASWTQIHLSRRGPDGYGKVVQLTEHGVLLMFQSSILQLRGQDRTLVPLLEDDSKNILAFNGEIFDHGGRQVSGSDSMWLFQQLEQTKGNALKIEKLLSNIRGPWCLVFWHMQTDRLWIAKDPFGRRSLLLCFSHSQKTFTIASVVESNHDELWTECPPGIYSIDTTSWHARERKVTTRLKYPALMSHTWCGDEVASTLFLFRRQLFHMKAFPEGAVDCTNPKMLLNSNIHINGALWSCLDDAVQSRVLQVTHWHQKPHSAKSYFESSKAALTEAKFSVLFSGGIDSTVLCALLHRNLQAGEIVDLCNVCFDNGNSPDRAAALSAVQELKRACPGRNWRLIEIDVSSIELSQMRRHIETLIRPCSSVMDFNIGAALWFSARGVGTINVEGVKHPYRTKSRIIISGQGADELFGGYSRHRAIFNSFGHVALEECLRTDFLRLWRRNLSRDDRVIADHGREARYPYLDEQFVHAALRLPLRSLVDLSLPSGVGDKKCLRELASHFGLGNTSQRVKRAIQFGSRISTMDKGIPE